MVEPWMTFAVMCVWGGMAVWAWGLGHYLTCGVALYVALSLADKLTGAL